MNQYSNLVVNTLFLIANFFLTLAIFIIDINFNNLELYLVVLILFFALVVFYLPRFLLWAKIYFWSIIIFLCLHPLFKFFGLIDENANYLTAAAIKAVISSKGELEAYRMLIFFILGTSFGILFLRLVANGVDGIGPDNQLPVEAKSLFPYKIIQIAFLACFFLMLADHFNNYRNSIALGYVGAFHLGDAYRNPIFIIADILYPLLFAIYLFQNAFNKKNGVSEKKFLVISSIFLFPYFLSFLGGFRGEFVSLAIVLFSIYSMHIRRVGFIYLFGIIVISLTLIVSMEFIRFGQASNIFDVPFELYLEGFLYAGNSFNVLGYTYDYASSLDLGYRYFFGPLIGSFSLGETYSVEGLYNKPYFPQHLMYAIDHEKFLRGSTIGGSSVAELYLINNSNLYIYIGAIAIVLIADFFSRNMLKSSFYLFFGVIFFQTLFFSPRGGFLKFIDKEFIVALVFYFIIYLFYFVTSKKKL